MKKNNSMKDYDTLKDDLWKEFAEEIDARIIDKIMETVSPAVLRFSSATEAFEFKKYNTYYPADDTETKIRWYVENYKWKFNRTMFPTM